VNVIVVYRSDPKRPLKDPLSEENGLAPEGLYVMPASNELYVRLAA